VSDTPKTDAAVEWATCRPGPISSLAEFARSLERENAALREAGHLAEKIIVQRTDEIRHLERENAALRHTEENLVATVRGLEFELEKAQTKVVALRQDKERLLKVIEDLESLARPAMREANMCGAGYDIDEELRGARLIIDAARAKEGGAT
jgi:chromosome segregation ATPase